MVGDPVAKKRLIDSPFYARRDQQAPIIQPVKPRFNISLTQMVTFTLVGAVLMSSGFLLMSWAHLNRDHSTAVFWLRLLTSLAPLVIGGFINIKGGSDLKDGIANQRWQQDEVASFRGIFESALWQIVSIGTMIVGLRHDVGRKTPSRHRLGSVHLGSGAHPHVLDLPRRQNQSANSGPLEQPAATPLRPLGQPLTCRRCA